MDVLTQFFVGVYTEDLVYIDDWQTVVLMTFKSVSGFWFDSFTSIPWSFLDLQLYMVLSLAHGSLSLSCRISSPSSPSLLPNGR